MREQLLEVISRHWGYDAFRPLQEEAMLASMEARDSLVVMPTGGGKSLCYQVPALFRDETTIVISPLISLMKDQVDGLRACGVSAAQLNSSLSAGEQRVIEKQLLGGELRILFASPERLAMASFRQLLQRAGAKTFAIDEAHCISHWGHDFRPEYRQLRHLKETFPGCSVHAYTATATEQVRRDIAEQLALQSPLLLVGNFDRPNLTYRILPRHDEITQIVEVLDRHKGEAGIIYCVRRKDVDETTAELRRRGINALAYHAGMTADERRDAQEAFATEKCDLVVATVAFGMGIDRSNVRFVMHLAMPKSIEHYQQETGRAGRDGLEAECVMLYSGADAVLWRSMIDRSAGEEPNPDYVATANRHLSDMDRYCSGAICRHRALVTYFGQSYDTPNCGACDICLGDTEETPEALLISQKILSCVYRVGQSFGVSHVIGVLRGENTERIRERHHDRLSTYGLLRGCGRNELRDWIYQLVSQGYLTQTDDQYPVLHLTQGSKEVMRGLTTPRLLQIARKEKKQRTASRNADTLALDTIDRGLFERLREWRRAEATERGVPPYVVFSDRTLREIAKLRPTTAVELRDIYGIGEAKLEAFGQKVVQVVRDAG
jgi:ATP-dependent DNA helicase RecQ